jgi:hypothetical protein
MVKRVVFAMGVAAAALLAQLAGAQALYKSTMPDGKVIYGDKPAPGAVKVEQSKPDTSKKGIAEPTKREAAALKELQDARQKRESAANKVEAAQKALQAAEAARAAGKEPLAGERLGTAGGNQRLTDAYWARQKKLDQDDENARKALADARAGR